MRDGAGVPSGTPTAAAAGVDNVPTPSVSQAATAQLLWAICDPWTDPAKIARLLPHADTGLLVERAIDHRVAPLLWAALGRSGTRSQLDDEVLGRLRAEAARWRARAYYLPRAVHLAVAPLAGAGFEPVLFKGPTLAIRYPDPALRPMVDIDLLLPRRQHAAAVARLAAAGWRPVPVPGRVHYERLLLHPEIPALGLELHAALDTWHERATDLGLEEVWTRRRPLRVWQTSAWGPDAADEILALAVHAAKPFHCFDRLVWVADLTVVCRNPMLDWDTVALRARRARCATVLAVALRLARRAGAQVPDELCRLPRSRWRRAALEPVLQPAWPLARPDLATRRRLRFAFPDSSIRRFLLLLGEGKEQAVWRQLTGAPPRAIGAALALGRWILRSRGVVADG